MKTTYVALRIDPFEKRQLLSATVEEAIGTEAFFDVAADNLLHEVNALTPIGKPQQLEDGAFQLTESGSIGTISGFDVNQLLDASSSFVLEFDFVIDRVINGGEVIAARFFSGAPGTLGASWGAGNFVGGNLRGLETVAVYVDGWHPSGRRDPHLVLYASVKQDGALETGHLIEQPIHIVEGNLNKVRIEYQAPQDDGEVGKWVVYFNDELAFEYALNLSDALGGADGFTAGVSSTTGPARGASQDAIVSRLSVATSSSTVGNPAVNESSDRDPINEEPQVENVADIVEAVMEPKLVEQLLQETVLLEDEDELVAQALAQQVENNASTEFGSFSEQPIGHVDEAFGRPDSLFDDGVDEIAIGPQQSGESTNNNNPVEATSETSAITVGTGAGLTQLKDSVTSTTDETGATSRSSTSASGEQVDIAPSKVAEVDHSSAPLGQLGAEAEEDQVVQYAGNNQSEHDSHTSSENQQLDTGFPVMSGDEAPIISSFIHKDVMAASDPDLILTPESGPVLDAYLGPIPFPLENHVPVQSQALSEKEGKGAMNHDEAPQTSIVSRHNVDEFGIIAITLPAGVGLVQSAALPATHTSKRDSWKGTLRPGTTEIRGRVDSQRNLRRVYFQHDGTTIILDVDPASGVNDHGRGTTSSYSNVESSFYVHSPTQWPIDLVSFGTETIVDSGNSGVSGIVPSLAQEGLFMPSRGRRTGENDEGATTLQYTSTIVLGVAKL